MPTDSNQISEAKTPAYVLTYDKLRALLSDGMTYPVGSKLPSEPRLAEMLGTSRMTLRQALALLMEDGLVSKFQGKGNFVTKRGRLSCSSFEKMGHPVYKCCIAAIDDTEMDFRLEPTNEYYLEIFKKDTQVAVAVDRWYRSAGEIVAYTLSLMPLETIDFLGVELKHPDSLLTMLESGIYEVATRSSMLAQLSYVGDFISEKYVISSDKNMILIAENIYNGDEYTPLCCNKHYIVPQNCAIEINALR